jgi:hypothetical protein
MEAADGAAHVHRSGPRRSRLTQEKGQIMKHITGTALRAAGCVVLLVTGVALLAGKNDIRKFRQMRKM